MWSGRRTFATCLILLPVLALSAWLIALPRHTWIELTDAGTGRPIASSLLADGEQVILTWTNSLFSLPVTEVFVAGGGALTLTAVTFADPAGREPPRVRPEDVDDLYHTGGPFRAEGLSRPFSRILFRVGEIGRPAIRLGSRVVQLEQEVGFGGAVLLVARSSSLRERIGALLALSQGPWFSPPRHQGTKEYRVKKDGELRTASVPQEQLSADAPVKMKLLFFLVPW